MAENNELTSKKRLATNTAMLFILTMSNYVFGFITVPYQTRVLGPDLYGIMGFAMATMGYFQVVLDYGFTLSGTAEIARKKDNPQETSKTVESIILCKLFLFCLCCLGLIILSLLIDKVRDYILIFWIFLLYSFSNTLIPDFLYRGMENMKPITYRTVFIKFLFTMMIFAFVKTSSDYVLIPVFYLIGSVVAVVIAYYDVKKRYALKLEKLSFRQVLNTLKTSSPFFVSRVATTVYGATNMFLLGLRYAGMPALGHYTAADKFVSVAKMGASPIADSLYPYLIANRDFKTVKRIFLVLMPIIVLMGAILFWIAPTLCVMLFGADYADAAPVLRALIPVMVMILPQYILGFPVMTPLGIAHKANISVIIGAFVQIFLLIFVWTQDMLTAVNVCICTSITEFVILTYRSISIYLAVKKAKDKEAKVN